MKVKLFSHSDLDGVGCEVLACLAFGENVDVTICDYHNVNEKIVSFLENEKPTDYNKIIITDISVSEQVADKLDLIDRGKVSSVTLLDHHNTALWLNKYPWALVDSKLHNDPILKSSGTSLLIDYLRENHGGLTPFMEDFAEQVRRYDTWEWHTYYNDDAPKSLNLLLSILGRKDFVNLMLEYSKTKKTCLDFDKTSDALIKQRTKETDQYIKSHIKRVKKFTIGDYTAGVVFAENNASELGNAIASQVKGIDFALIINLFHGSLSFRGIRDDIDLGADVAAKFGGGGHPKASGATLNEDSLKNVIELLISGYDQ